MTDPSPLTNHTSFLCVPGNPRPSAMVIVSKPVDGHFPSDICPWHFCVTVFFQSVSCGDRGTATHPAVLPCFIKALFPRGKCLFLVFYHHGNACDTYGICFILSRCFPTGCRPLLVSSSRQPRSTQRGLLVFMQMLILTEGDDPSHVDVGVPVGIVLWKGRMLSHGSVHTCSQLARILT